MSIFKGNLYGKNVCFSKGTTDLRFTKKGPDATNYKYTAFCRDSGGWYRFVPTVHVSKNNTYYSITQTPASSEYTMIQPTKGSIENTTFLPLPAIYSHIEKDPTLKEYTMIPTALSEVSVCNT